MSEAVKQRARAGIVNLYLVASIIIGASLSSVPALAAGAPSEASFKDAGTLELPRMVVPALGRSGESGAQVTLDHMRPVDPGRLRRLIVERLAATKLPPIRSLLLQSFVIKPSAVTN